MAGTPDGSSNGNGAANERVLGLAQGNALSSLRGSRPGRVSGPDGAGSATGDRQHRWCPDGSEPPGGKRRANGCAFIGTLAWNDCEAFVSAAIEWNGCETLLRATLARNGRQTLQHAADRRYGREAFFRAPVERHGVTPFVVTAVLRLRIAPLELRPVGAEVRGKLPYRQARSVAPWEPESRGSDDSA